MVHLIRGSVAFFSDHSLYSLGWCRWRGRFLSDKQDKLKKRKSTATSQITFSRGLGPCVLMEPASTLRACVCAGETTW